jgi:hypothetical protein
MASLHAFKNYNDSVRKKAACRPSGEFEKASAEGAVNVPLFRALDFSKPTPGMLLRAAAYALNGVQGVEPNPNFAAEMKERSAGKKVILVRALAMLLFEVRQSMPSSDW